MKHPPDNISAIALGGESEVLLGDSVLAKFVRRKRVDFAVEVGLTFDPVQHCMSVGREKDTSQFYTHRTQVCMTNMS